MAELLVWMFALFFVLALLGFPISFSLGISVTVPLMITGALTLNTAGSWMLQGINSFPLLACPFFILAGNLMEGGGISKRLVDVASTLVGSIPGGLGMVAAIACVFFGAISGSGPATLAAIGGIMIPAMVARGYSAAWSAALCATAGCIGIFIPPSVAMINYGVISGASIAKMLLSGVIPGLMTALGLCVLSYFKGKRCGWGGGEHFSFQRFLRSMKEGIWPLLMPIIILGGIYSGLFTPTEAAAVACAYAFVVGVFVTKELTWERLKNVLVRSAGTSATIMFIIAAASASRIIPVVSALVGARRGCLRLLLGLLLGGLLTAGRTLGIRSRLTRLLLGFLFAGHICGDLLGGGVLGDRLCGVYLPGFEVRLHRLVIGLVGECNVHVDIALAVERDGI